jgi:hypothetical protein
MLIRLDGFFIEALNKNNIQIDFQHLVAIYKQSRQLKKSDHTASQKVIKDLGICPEEWAYALKKNKQRG